MSNTDQQLVAQSLLELSDAIEQLALIIEQQKNRNLELKNKQLAVITTKFNRSATLLHRQFNPQTPNNNIHSIHQKGFLLEWLKQKNIFVSTAVENLNADENLYKTADYLAEHFNKLKPFYQQLKRNQNIKSDFKFKSNAQAIKYIQNWCNLLHKHKIIDAFKHINDSEIFVDISDLHDAILFVNGNWLEILLRREVAINFQKNIQHIQKFDILSQTVILKPDNSHTELDLLLMINEQIYWFECKSGKISDYYERFAKHRKLLGLPCENSFLVIPHSDAQIPLQAKKRSGMLTLFGTTLEQQLQQIFKLHAE